MIAGLTFLPALLNLIVRIDNAKRANRTAHSTEPANPQ
jgi:hypothetical protein